MYSKAFWSLIKTNKSKCILIQIAFYSLDTNCFLQWLSPLPLITLLRPFTKKYNPRAFKYVKCIHDGLCNPFFQGVTRYFVTIASLEKGYTYLSCCYLYSFTSYDLKIKYLVTRGYYFPLDVVFACCYMKGLTRLRYHFYKSIVYIVL